MTPLIVLIYNRPDKVSRMIEALREFRPDPLFIFSDGPKELGDAFGVEQCVDLIYGRVDWTKPRLIRREYNLGLAKSVVSAVDIVLSEYDRMVLLEDDCIPGLYFMDYMNLCLSKYENNPKVLGISGYTIPIPEELRRAYQWDVWVYGRIGSWGWGTWKHKWAWYERDRVGYEQAIREGVNLARGGKDVKRYIELWADGGVDTWTPGWELASCLRDCYYIYPTVSHIENIGFDGSGVHCGITNRYKTPVCTEILTRLPDEIIIDERFVGCFKKVYGE